MESNVKTLAQKPAISKPQRLWMPEINQMEIVFVSDFIYAESIPLFNIWISVDSFLERWW